MSAKYGLFIGRIPIRFVPVFRMAGSVAGKPAGLRVGASKAGNSIRAQISLGYSRYPIIYFGYTDCFFQRFLILSTEKTPGRSGPSGLLPGGAILDSGGVAEPIAENYRRTSPAYWGI